MCVYTNLSKATLKRKIIISFESQIKTEKNKVKKSRQRCYILSKMFRFKIIISSKIINNFSFLCPKIPFTLLFV